MSTSVVQLSLKRIGFLLSAIIIAAIVPELLSQDGFQWNIVWDLSKAPLAYWLLTTFRDYRDPTIPNLTPEPPAKEPTKIVVQDLNEYPSSKPNTKG